MADKIEMRELDSTQEQLMDPFKVADVKFARFGDIGCILPSSYKEDADNYRNMAVRPDDVWVATFPRSGTTFTSELVWLLMNNLDYDTALKVPLTSRVMFNEMMHIPGIKRAVDVIMLSHETIRDSPSPRCIKTHLPFSLLPKNILETAKIVYVARDPRDVAVSFYHLNSLFRVVSGDFKTYWNLFIKDLVLYSPFFPRLKEAWALRDHPNMLFMFYEDMIKDLPSAIKRIANFLNKEVTEVEIKKLCEHLDITNFRKNKSVDLIPLNKDPKHESFVRKGKSGGWRKHFDEEMAAQAQQWMRENLAGSDLRFPDTSS